MKKKTLVEYKNVTENEIMVFEIWGDEDFRHVAELKPNETIFLCDKDMKAHVNDVRFLQGRIVPVGSDRELSMTNELSDIMTDIQIEYFVKNVTDIDFLAEKLPSVHSINTITRLLKEAKKPERGKTYSFVAAVEEHLGNLVRNKEALLGKKEKESSINTAQVKKEKI